MAVPYTFDKKLYTHSAKQYFALAAAELYRGRVCLVLYTTKPICEKRGTPVITPTTNLRYICAKIAEGLYVDAQGAFTNIAERISNLELYQGSIVECTIQEAKVLLKSLKIPYTNTEMKRNAREFLRNNLLTLGIGTEPNLCLCGICGKTGINGSDYFLTYRYTPQQRAFGKFLSSFPTTVFVRDITQNLGFISAPNWYYTF